jgi:hypothetical protein
MDSADEAFDRVFVNKRLNQFNISLSSFPFTATSAASLNTTTTPEEVLIFQVATAP